MPHQRGQSSHPASASLGRRASAAELLKEALAEAFDGRSVVPIRTVVVSGTAVGVLVEQSRWADLVVVGRATRSEVAGVLLGAVSLAVAEHAQAPVLTIPPGVSIAVRRETAPLLSSARR